MARRYLTEHALAARDTTIAPFIAGDRSARPILTPRERDVLFALTRGGRNQDIAAELGLSAKTVMHHSVAIYRKLGVRGRTEAVAWAYRSGLVREDPPARP